MCASGFVCHLPISHARHLSEFASCRRLWAVWWPDIGSTKHQERIILAALDDTWAKTESWSARYISSRRVICWIFQLFFLCFTHHSLPGAYSLLMAFTGRLRPMRGTFARVLAGIWKGRDFTCWNIWKGREICHFRPVKRPKSLIDAFYRPQKSQENILALWLINSL